MSSPARTSGTVVSEKGSAYTWVENAHEFRLTPLHNDPVSDAAGKRSISAMTRRALLVADAAAVTRKLRVCVPARLRLQRVRARRNRHRLGGVGLCGHGCPREVRGGEAAQPFGALEAIVATGYWELVLGEWRHANLMHIVTERDPDTGALLARNAYSSQERRPHRLRPGSEPGRTITGNRTEFIGRNGSPADPAALHRTRLSGRPARGSTVRRAAGGDPAGRGAGARGRLRPRGGGDADEARRLIQRFGARRRAAGPGSGVGALEPRLGAVYVETPDRALDVLANGWLLYQALSSRFLGRSGYYQSGGAYGFRDQLQDALALLHAAPWLTREHLLRCAERQFREGDVQHWWHPPGGRGVRTHSSDDYLWLPYATCRYVQATGDTGVLDEQLPFLEGRALNPDEESYYDLPQTLSEVARLYEHCAALGRHGLRFGAHGLPLMGGGDWNDGMNLVGHEGRGESVWLAWFLYENLRCSATWPKNRGDQDVARVCADRRRSFGPTSRRTPGTAAGTSGHISTTARHWAPRPTTNVGSIRSARVGPIISGAGDPARTQVAMEAVDRLLVDRDAGLIRLLDPPFDRSALEPGYIKGYVPGVRENGGQYTHAAIWAAMAFAMMGDSTRAWELFSILNPINHAGRPADVEVYKVEPYVMCADIYGAPPHTGRGGWTWYTGAAGWMYRLAVETLIGLHLEVDRLRLLPRVPADWGTFKVHYRYRETFHHITFTRAEVKPERTGATGLPDAPIDGMGQVTRIVMDGVELKQPGPSQGTIPLQDDRRDHFIEVDFQ